MEDLTRMGIQHTDLKRTKADGPEPVVLGRQSHGFAAQGLAEIHHVALPLDLAVGAHSYDQHLTLVHGFGDAGRVTPGRRGVETGRGLLAQGLVGSLLVVMPAEGVEGSLLGPQRGPSGARSLRLQRPVQPLQPPVLLGVAWGDPLRHDPQLYPPHRQGRQASQPRAGEGWPVVRADGPWEPIFPEGPLQHSLDCWSPGLLQAIAHQQVARGGVRHGQRVAPPSVSRPKPPLEVYRPDVVGSVSRGEGLAPRGCPLDTTPALNQARPLKDAARSARRRPAHLRMALLQPRDQLPRPPRGVRPLGTLHLPCHLQRRLVRVRVRGPAHVAQPVPPQLLEPPNALVAGLGADPKLVAQIHEAHSPALPPLNEPSMLLLRVRLSPGHSLPSKVAPPPFRKVLPMSPVYVLPMYPVCTHLNPPPQGGRRLFPSPLQGEG